MKYRFPRKIKKLLPIGFYCYTGKRFDISTGIYHISPCKFLQRKVANNPEINANPLLSWCGAIKDEVLDQCKSCGEKYFKNGYRNNRKRRPRKLFTKKLEYVW